MKAMITETLLLAANSCSGHGSCGPEDACECYHGYFGGDCSLRKCLNGPAWADTPTGDLNHDGVLSASAETEVSIDGQNFAQPEYFLSSASTSIKPALGEAHFYSECSSRGICDRKSGECQCFEGYSGSSCQRDKCPNDCSGNGVCFTLKEIAEQALNKVDIGSARGAVTHAGVSTPFEYRLWDASSRRACICDPSFSGFDCSLRLCPRGDDPMTTAQYSCGGECKFAQQTLRFDAAAITAASLTGMQVNFALKHAHWDGAIYKTEDTPISLGTAGSSASIITQLVKDSLLRLPNSAISDIVVTCTESLSGDSCTSSTPVALSFDVAVTFRTPSGPQEQLTVAFSDVTTGAATAYSPYISVIPASTVVGNRERVECSARGLCEYSSGECRCFAGFTGPSCSVQNALATGQVNSRGAAAASAAAGSSSAAASEASSGQPAGASTSGDASASAEARERRRLQRKRAKRRR